MFILMFSRLLIEIFMFILMFTTQENLLYNVVYCCVCFYCLASVPYIHSYASVFHVFIPLSLSLNFNSSPYEWHCCKWLCSLTIPQFCPCINSCAIFFRQFFHCYMKHCWIWVFALFVFLLSFYLFICHCSFCVYPPIFITLATTDRPLLMGAFSFKEPLLVCFILFVCSIFCAAL